jgi:hypothetical protein
MDITDRIEVGYCKHQLSETGIKLTKPAEEERRDRTGEVNAKKRTHSFLAYPDGSTRVYQHPSPPHRELRPSLGAHCQRAVIYRQGHDPYLPLANSRHLRLKEVDVEIGEGPSVMRVLSPRWIQMSMSMKHR